MCYICQLNSRPEKGLDCLDVVLVMPAPDGPRGELPGSVPGLSGAVSDVQGLDTPDSLEPVDWQNPGVDTVPGSTASTFALAAGQRAVGYVNFSGDQDWYRVTLTAGQQYTFALNGWGQGAVRDPVLELRNSAGTIIASNDDGGPWLGSQLTFTASASGTYFLTARGLGSNVGQYMLTMNNGSSQYLPTVGVGEVADYLTHTYWNVHVNGGAGPRAWGITTISFNLQGIEAARHAIVREAFQVWAQICGLTFVETTGAANITLDDNQAGAFASHSFTGSTITSATINVAANWDGGSSTRDSYTFQTFIHEIGHALGFGHSGPYNQSATYGIDNIYANDSWQMSIMSYFSQQQAGVGSYRFVMTPMMADILAAQRHYGAATTRTGDTVYGHGSNAGALYNFASYTTAPSFTIYDSGGTDTLNGSGYSNNQTFDLRPGAYSSIGGLTNNIGIYLTTVIENAVGGSGNDRFIGNTANNVINGGGGFDTFVFNGSRSQFTFTETNDYVVSGAGQGTDTLISIERFEFNDITIVDDYRGGTATTGTIGVGGTATGSTQFIGDRDWFSTSLQAGHSYVLTLRGAQSSVGTLADPFLRLHNGAGTQIGSNDDGGWGLESQLAIRVGTNGTYYLSAGAFGTNLGTYLVGLEDLGTSSTRFQAHTLQVNNFGFSPSGGGWSSQDRFPRTVADVDGNGLADIVGFGIAGVWVARATGPNQFAPAELVVNNFGADPSAGGWSSNDLYARRMADVNGDGRADVVGFGIAGVYVALANAGGGYNPVQYVLQNFGTDPSAGGWSSDNIYTRQLGDVNGDGRADIVGFGIAGVYVALGDAGGGFGPAQLRLQNFGTSPEGGGWTSYDRYPRTLADVNGDGRADIVGFGENGVFVALADGTGGFAPAQFVLQNFAASPSGGGWSSYDRYPRAVADVNADGRADIVGFGEAGLWVALASGGGNFSPAAFDLDHFGPSAGGWSSQDRYPRVLGDVTGDGRADIIAFGEAGAWVSRGFDFLIV